MNYTRNSDMNYYDSDSMYTNCGSYALRLKEWYDPEDYFCIREGYPDEWAEEKSREGYTNEEISAMYGDILVEGMLEEFAGELELCDGQPPSTNDKELIAFNTFCYVDEDEGYYADVDFHFKVFRNNQWMEKCGWSPVEECKKDDWGRYIGKVFYFYHKIA